jgi:DNA ligase 1
MKRFTDLYTEMDKTNRTSQKLTLLKKYFSEALPEDAAWGLYFLSGDRIKRLLPTKLLRDWVMQQAGLPEWLVDECYNAVGDFAETLALLLPSSAIGTQVPLHTLIEERLQPLAALSDDERRRLMLQTWQELSTDQKLVWNKLITGEFRVGVSRTLVIRALADVAGVSPGVMAHRMMGGWKPSAAAYRGFLNPENQAQDLSQPYPFFLAYPIDGTPESLGDLSAWQAEWKWDGIRGQVIRREGSPSIWSRGEDLVTERFPEIRDAAAHLPSGTVLDGEILGWRGKRPLSFGFLQTRLGRKNVTARLREEAPVAFMAYDLLEAGGVDLRERPLSQRRQRLEAILAALPANSVFRVSPVVQSSSWETLREAFGRAREQGVEGLMLKRLASPYRVGRVKGDWWKWKIDPYHIDAVLIYAQHGHGRRASLFTDYTFGVWKEGQLVPVAKAYSGLTDEEILKVDAFVRRNTLERFGPVRVVKPELVFELAFEGIQPSNRHKAGVAVRFPRMSRWRLDKKPDEADTLEALKALAQTAWGSAA